MKNTKTLGSCCQNIHEALPLKTLRALADPSRLAVIERFIEMRKSMTVGEVASCCPHHLSVISRHLLQLREAGLLSAEKKGKEVHYQLNTREIALTLKRASQFFDSLSKRVPQ